MGIFKKKTAQQAMTPDETIVACTQNKQKLEDKKKPSYIFDRHGKYVPSYRNQSYNAKIDRKIEVEDLKIALAKENKKNPPPAPEKVYNDYSKHYSADVKIKSDNKNGVFDSFNNNGNNNGNRKTPAKQTSTKKSDKQPQKQTQSKKPKAKTIFFCIVAVLIAGLLIYLSVTITNCMHDKKDKASTIYTVMTI